MHSDIVFLYLPAVNVKTLITLEPLNISVTLSYCP